MIGYPDYIDCYPPDNDAVKPNAKQRQKVIDYINTLDELKNKAEKAMNAAKTDTDKRQWQAKLYNRYIAQMDAVIKVCDMLGYQLEWDWYGHRNTFFFATRLDAMVQEDYIDDLFKEE